MMGRVGATMNIKLFQALRAVIELGSITEAIQMLNLTQPGSQPTHQRLGA
jgi:hypothetical protein